MLNLFTKITFLNFETGKVFNNYADNNLTFLDEFVEFSLGKGYMVR